MYKVVLLPGDFPGPSASYHVNKSIRPSINDIEAIR
jgi:hypothetical protein